VSVSALGAQILDLVHEAEGAGAADLLDEGGARRKSTSACARAIAEHRVIEVDGEGDLEAIEGKEAGFLVSVLDGHGPLDADELFCRGLLLDPRGLDQEYEGARRCRP
jgi:hypothetical protein